MGSVASQAEVKFAQAFVKQLGGDWHNTFLLTAVVAWMRQESGGLSKVIGNNPFNLRPGADDAKYRSGVRQSRNGNGYFSVYATLEKGAQAAANRLVRAGNDWRGYGLIVAAARRVGAGQQAGLDFLTAVALSAWDAAHYGAPDGDPQKNHLIRVWASITGLQMPAATASTKQTKAPPPKPQPPRPLQPPTPPSILYIQPYAARGFYAEKHDTKHANGNLAPVQGRFAQ